MDLQGARGCQGTVALPCLENSPPKVRDRAGAEALQSPVAQVRNRVLEEQGRAGSGGGSILSLHLQQRCSRRALRRASQSRDFLLGQRKWDLALGTSLPVEGVSGGW